VQLGDAHKLLVEQHRGLLELAIDGRKKGDEKPLKNMTIGAMMADG
jgi:hypothetical protein